jgi:hypothetical protein
MDESIAAQSAFIRSYLLKDGRLYLSLMAPWWDHGDRLRVPMRGSTSLA